MNTFKFVDKRGGTHPGSIVLPLSTILNLSPHHTKKEGSEKVKESLGYS